MSSLTRFFVPLTAAALLTLSACSSTQTVPEACETADELMNDVLTSVQSDLQGLLSDVDAGKEVDVAGVLSPIEKGLAEAQEEISNTEVNSAVGDFADAFSQYLDPLESIDFSQLAEIDEGDPDAASKTDEVLAPVMDEVEAGSQAMMEAANQLSELCN